MQQIYRRTTILKYDFNKVANNFFEITFRHWYSPVNLLHIFRAPFPQNTFGGMLLEKWRNEKVLEITLFKN